MKNLIRRLLCKFGFHNWKSDSDYFIGIASNREVTLVWWQCKDCCESKLKFISH